MEDLLSLRDAAELAGVRADTLRQAVHRGSLAATKIGTDWVVTRAALEDYLASGAQGWDKRRRKSVGGGEVTIGEPE